MHHLNATPQTVHWGFFDASQEPCLVIDSGETVVMSAVNGGPERMPAAPFVVPDALTTIHRECRAAMPGHICTGPVAVRGLEAGGVLEVRIVDIQLSQDWGWHAYGPSSGLLRGEFEQPAVAHIPLDREAMVARLACGAELPVRPFFGLMAVAPPPAWGRISTLPPRNNGGNMDNKELVAGSTLYLPAFVDGGNFSVGDGHAAQGDGEVTGTAIETGLTGKFEFHARKDMSLEWPMAETPEHLITMGFDPDTDRAMTIALREMVNLVAARTGMPRGDAYTLCSLAGDIRITQAVSSLKGAHFMLAKRYVRTGDDTKIIRRKKDAV
ncbi:MAG: acetamidase/formamidase family protein [Aquamicrobium sp.]|uniref:acetamidase/formamidase family protein n=1 Tax=Aquamicrobium sp. TaxID=1872579 RepID=UPI00349E5AE9|nr:acetamidase/formamidase family protein [Aquamicrobium sp.]